MMDCTSRAATGLAAIVLGVGLAVAPAAAEELKVFDWSGYEDPGFYGAYLENHEAPAYTFFGDEEEAFTKLRSGFTADLAHPCIGVTRKWADAKVIKPIDTSKIANWEQLMPAIRDIDGIQFDGQIWMVPFDWGNSGLIYRTDKIPAEEISLAALTDPKYEGKLAIPDIVTSAYAMAAAATGVRDWTDMNEAQLEAATQYLRDLHKNVRFYWTDPGQLDQALASGEILAGWGWNQTELNLLANDIPAVMLKGVDKGVATWVCGYVHLADGETSDEAVYAMLNALASKETGKYIIEAWGYAHSNAEAYEEVDPALIERYGFNDPTRFFEESLLTSALPPAIEAKMIEEFERIKSGF